MHNQSGDPWQALASTYDVLVERAHEVRLDQLAIEERLGHQPASEPEV